jgi:hypothetical protein
MVGNLTNKASGAVADITVTVNGVKASGSAQANVRATAQ